LEASGWRDVQKGERVYVFDREMNQVNSFGSPDPRLRRYRFMPWSSIAADTEHLYLTDTYDMSLNRHDAAGRHLERIPLPGYGNEADVFWEKALLDDQSKRAIRLNTHRFAAIYGSGPDLMLLEHQFARKIFRLWRFDARNEQFVVYRNLALNSFNGAAPIFDLYPGAYAGGLVAVIEDEQTLGRFKKHYPAYDHLELALYDNPLVVFLAPLERAPTEELM
jgi:hypothetical protein